MKNVVIKYTLILCIIFTLLASVYYFLLISTKTANNLLTVFFSKNSPFFAEN